MSDYFDRIESHLREAVDRNARHSGETDSRERSSPALRGAIARLLRSPLRSRRSGMVAVFGALLLSGSAAGAALLSTERSKPLAGTVPAYRTEGRTISVAGSHYEIELAPSLTAGSIGWCSEIIYSRIHRFRGALGGRSCAGAPALGAPLFAADSGRGNGISYVLTAPDVAAVRVAGRQIVLTRGSRELPYGYRAAVFESHHSEFPSTGPLRLTALDADGNVIPGGAYQGPPQEQTATWSSSDTPPRGACSIGASPRSGMHVDGGAVVTRLIADPGIIGRAFLSCEQVALSIGGERALATLLLDAKHPGTPPGQLPDVRPLQGRPGLYVSAGKNRAGAFAYFARRLPDAWLVLTYARTRASAVAALTHLVAGTTDASVPPHAVAMPGNAECRIDAPANAHLTLVSETALFIHGIGGIALRRGNRPEFAQCSTADLLYRGWTLRASVFYRVPASTSREDAHTPIFRTESTGRFARRRSVPRQPGMFTIPGEYGLGVATVKRIGTVWLEVDGGSGAQQQEAVLRRLRVRVSRRPALERSLRHLRSHATPLLPSYP